MDSPPVVSMEALWPELPDEHRRFEVVVTVAREDGGEIPAPRALPPEVRGWWSAGHATVKATVMASSASRAVAVMEALVPELTRAAGATVTAHAPGEAEELRAEQGLALLREAAERATDEDRAWVARVTTHIDAQRAQLPDSHRWESDGAVPHID
jgi:hypothetical protein